MPLCNICRVTVTDLFSTQTQRDARPSRTTGHLDCREDAMRERPWENDPHPDANRLTDRCIICTGEQNQQTRRCHRRLRGPTIHLSRSGLLRTKPSGAVNQPQAPLRSSTDHAFTHSATCRFRSQSRFGVSSTEARLSLPRVVLLLSVPSCFLSTAKVGHRPTVVDPGNGP